MKNNPLAVLSTFRLLQSSPSRGALRWLAFIAALTLPFVGGLRAEAPPTTLRIAPAGTDIEGLKNFGLQWNAVPNATYLLERADTLAPGSPWHSLDAIKPPDVAGSYQFSVMATDTSGFYRLVLPQPDISSVEPAVFAPGVAVDFSLIGQCFASGDVVRVDGVAVGGVVFVNSGLLRFTLPPQSAGTHLVELVRAGVVKASFSVTGADAFANPELVLQEPPEEPPAAPRRPVGRITFKAKEGATLARGLKEEIRENDNVTFDVQEGKKGLNAVNVKLARMAGGDHDPIIYPGAPDKCGDGMVQECSGEMQQQVVDLAVEGRGLDFVWVRRYRSRTGTATTMGQRWTHSYDVSCTQNSSGGMDVYDGTGRKDTFVLQANGTYTCPQFFREGTLTGGVFRLTFADTGYWEFKPFNGTATAGKLARSQDRNGNAMLLNYDASGRLAQIVDALGRTNTVAYDTAGRVAGVTDFSGRTVTYQYYQGLPGEPGGAGDLKSVTSPPVTGTPHGNDFPTGKTTTYTYSAGYADERENHLLLSVIDATGQTIRTHVYQHNQTDLEFLRCISIQHWTNTPAMISYLPQTPTPANQFATMRCVVNDPVGDVTECFYDARNRCVKLQEFTGRAKPGARVTATANRPAGKVRAGDPDVYETRWSWNNDSLCTVAVGPGGQQVQCVYESDFDPATRARKRADCRVVRERASSPVDLDGDGVADLTERVSYYDYDPRFGSDPSARPGKKLYVGNLPYSASERGPRQTTDLSGHGVKIITDRDSGRSKGFGFIKAEDGQERIISAKPGTAGRSKGIIVKKPGGMPAGKVNQTAGEQCDNGFGNNFITSATDPRGNVTEGNYDARGNRVKVKFPWLPGGEADFAYNPQGECTAITNTADANGRRSVDTFAYAQGQVVQCVEDAGAGGLALTTAFEYDPRGNPIRIIDPRSNDGLYTYNSLDQLVQAKSASLGSGSTGTYRIKTQFSYDANDNLTLVAEENRDAAGAPGTNAFWRTQFVYDGGQRLTGCWRDKNGALVLRCTEVAYNAANQVVLYRSPEAVNGNDASNTVAFAYDERGLDYRTIAAPGSSVQSTLQCDYDANGNVTRVSEGLEGAPSITTMEYDGFAGFGVYVGAPFDGTVECCDGHVSHPQDYITSHDPDSSQKKVLGTFTLIGCGLRQSWKAWVETVWNKQCVEKDTTVRLADAEYRLSKITDPMGNVTTFNYDAKDNLKVARHFGQLNDVPGTNGNIRLAESRYEYDGLDRPIRSRDSFFSLPSQAPIGDGERTTTFAYAPNSECTSITDDLGRVTTFAYDTACRPSSVSSPGGKSVIAVLRDQAGNVTQTTQTDQPDLGGPPQVFAWAKVYDALNRPISTTDNVGNSHRFAYDSRDNCVSAPDANGNETVYGYDGLSRTVQYAVYQGQESLGIVMSSGQFAYDDNDRCISSTDANGNVTLSAYDSLDRPTQTTQADGTHHSLVWSPRSNLIQETDANGTVILHAYDLNDRCIASNITPGAGVASTTTVETFAFDGASRLVAANNDGSKTGFEYDSLGNCTRGVSGGLGALTTYDSVGNRLTLTYPGGRVLTYAYDALDQCTNITETGASLASFSYAGPGRVARVIYGNGTRSDVTYDGVAGTPNAPGDFGHGQISSVTHAAAAGSPTYVAVNLSWDRQGNKTLRRDTIFAPAIPRTNTLGLQYDAADRLTRATVISDLTVLRDTVYGLDLMGNRTSVTGAASCSGTYFMDGLAPGSMDFQMNQYTKTPCDERTYDDNGNLVSRGSVAGPVTYQYDYAGRLVQVQALDFNSGALTPVASYAYDALGRRIARTVFSGGRPPLTTQFLYDGDGVIEERENGAVGASFVLDATRSQDDGVIQMRRGGQDYYYHTDDQGNVLALSGANGAIVERCDYDDYGAVTFLTGDGLATGATSSAVGNVYCWGGLRLESETGLHNNDGGIYVETQSGRCLARAQDDLQRAGSIVQLLTRNNPWSGGTSAARNVPRYIVKADGIVYDRAAWSGGGGSPNAMKTGTVKFFNEAKGFGMVTGGYWSASGQGSKNLTMKGQKIMQN